ncbi:MAG: hypothetical protein AB7P17_06330 [Nitrospirales bacterium]|nr:hypothetical protein [Nitrospirales bacterium]
MSRQVRWESLEGGGLSSRQCYPEGSKGIIRFGKVTTRYERVLPSCAEQCADCGGEIKIFVSPKRNPHSSKLGRAVSMKDHDLCRRCWRKLMHRQRQIGVIELPRSVFLGGSKLRSRLLIPVWPRVPKEAS